ncbi:Receptor-like protein kinase HERK 1 [Platanthera guangdongensis]|uniref:Receptor-like protein kinase HERK 1 n=1 Tax=Platanthera guangdongensis TaxID=2320717 RepID=A0ABR2LPQ0_9ASPA
MAGELLLLAVVILAHLLLLSCSSFAPIFLSCGSPSAINLSGDNPPRVFAPDDAYLLTSSDSQTAAFPNSSLLPIYSAARIFTSQASYRFALEPNAFYILRLHFLPFPSTAAARFNVSALNRFLLLSSFSPSSAAVAIKEFFIWVDTTPLLLTFSPVSTPATTTAFINALELLSSPANLIDGIQPLYVAPSQSTPVTNFSPLATETVYRLNVGGPRITPANDTLWRTWEPDDAFLFNELIFSLENSTSGRIEYPVVNGLTSKIAPDMVYSTARTINAAPVSNLQSFHFNLTWSFDVPPGFQYLVRMHFCNCWFPSPKSFFFQVYLGGLTASTDLNPGKEMVPSYVDFIVDSPDSGPLNLSIGPAGKSIPQNALLNGVEIMKLNNSFLSLVGPFGLFESGGSHGNKHLLEILLLSILGGLVLLTLLVLTAAFFIRRRQRRRLPEQKEKAPSWSNFKAENSVLTATSKSTVLTQNNSSSARLNLGLQIPFADVITATRNFDEKLVVGSGGFGKVFAGVLPDGTKVAVKRGMPGYKQGFPEFQTEIVVLSRIRHRHLVSLIGYCDEQSEMILVYEYMEKGTLRNHLYGSDLPSLSWKQRLEICIGAARGLHYLHTGYSQSIIHRDLKSTNILLGEKFVAKVSDFGLSRLGPSVGETHVSTGVKGTFGYFDPEYFKIQKLTEKSDVYSFGIVLFEVLCARPAIRDNVNLAELALHWQRKGKLEKIVDPKLEGDISENSLRKFGETAAKCLADYGVDRPSIGDVLWNLEYALQLQETQLSREPFEDSAILDESSQNLVAVLVRRAPAATEIDMEVNAATESPAARTLPEMSEITSRSVFSQLAIDDGR